MNGKHVIVTGAADGIGRAAAERYARRGARVSMFDIDEQRLATRAGELREAGHRATAIPVDLADAGAVRRSMEVALDQDGAPDIAVSNAGIAPYVELLDCEPEEWQRVIDVNLNGSFLFMQAAIRAMRESGVRGAVCQTSSGAAFQGRLGGGAYSASKAGALMMARVLAVEAGPHGIRVNSVAPGLVDHGYREGLGEFVPVEYAERARRLTPLDHLASAEDIVDAIEFLCSERSAHVSGTCLRIDGAASVGQYGSAWSRVD